MMMLHTNICINKKFIAIVVRVTLHDHNNIIVSDCVVEFPLKVTIQ